MRFRAGVHQQYRRTARLLELRKDFRDANLPVIRLHDLRHTGATMLMVQGLPAKVVMETLGHSQISLTLDTYSHVSSEQQGQAAEKMDEIFRSA